MVKHGEDRFGKASEGACEEISQARPQSFGSPRRVPTERAENVKPLGSKPYPPASQCF